MRLGLEFQAPTSYQPNIGDLYHLKVLPRESFVYVVHIAALATFAFIFMHVQVLKTGLPSF